MSEISTTEVYQRISAVLVSAFETLRDCSEITKIEKNFLVDWDHKLIDKVMKKIIKENPYYHINYQCEINCLTITVYRKGYYQLSQEEAGNVESN